MGYLGGGGGGGQHVHSIQASQSSDSSSFFFYRIGGFLKTWLPFMIISFVVLTIVVVATAVTQSS